MVDTSSGNRQSANPTAAVIYVMLFVACVVVVSAAALFFKVTPQNIAVIGFIAFSLIVVFFAAAVLWKLADGSIPLGGLIAEPPEPGSGEKIGKASLSRFQFLVFTFVVAGLFLMLCIETGAFVEVPTNVLALIGLSGGGFIASKAVGLPGQGKQISEEEKAAARKKRIRQLEKDLEDLKNEDAQAPKQPRQLAIPDQESLVQPDSQDGNTEPAAQNVPSNKENT